MILPELPELPEPGNTIKERRRRGDRAFLRQFNYFLSAYDLHADPKLENPVRLRMRQLLERMRDELAARAGA